MSAECRLVVITKHVLQTHLALVQVHMLDTEFAGMHGDEMNPGDDSSDDEGAYEDGASYERRGFVPFQDDTLSVLPCPARVPGDLHIGQKIACWFGPPFSQWYVGKITDVNRRRTKSDNVEAHFEGGSGRLVCEAAEYGTDKAWVLVGEQIEVES